MDLFCTYLPLGSKILDMGCAMGSFTKYVADKGYIVDGIDISENLIQIAKQKVKNVSFSVMDMLDLHLEKTYDGMMLINSIIHIEKKDMLKLFQSIYQILNQNGVVLVILLEGNGEQYVTEPLDPTILEFVNFYQSKEIEAIFLESGFQILQSSRIVEEKETELGNDQLVYYLKK